MDPDCDMCRFCCVQFFCIYILIVYIFFTAQSLQVLTFALVVFLWTLCLNYGFFAGPHHHELA